MTYANDCVRRKAWDLDFEAEASEVAGLRRVMRLHLTLWGLPELVDMAQLCVSELTANVINHVGVGTPTTLAVSMRDTYLRIEMHDPDARALPTLLDVACDAEAGRGMSTIDVITDRWGVILRENSKVVWCELATELTSPNGHTGGPRVTQAEECLSLYGGARRLRPPSSSGRLSLGVAEVAAIDLISDILHWLRAHGCDPDEALDRAQVRFEGELEQAVAE
ncbi:ATP-binding protein [Streptomyces apocyni]|uniref:ATP-binding protein n=1 Tax=Streptomyces apocyni TaxID=2654677 RepID=UPI0012E9C961|nr:ATP-binding protein [Streptomyces apocyni]